MVKKLAYGEVGHARLISRQISTSGESLKVEMRRESRKDKQPKNDV